MKMLLWVTVAAFSLCSTHLASAKVLRRVNVSSTNQEANGSTGRVAISGNGAVVAFDSQASNLVLGDTNLVRDIYVHVLATGQTSRVSVTHQGLQANNSVVDGLAIDGTGNRIFFASLASNMIPGDLNQATDVFYRDRALGITAGVGGASQFGFGACQTVSCVISPSVSADGTRVVFEKDSSVQARAFLHDLVLGTVSEVSVNSSGTPANPAVSFGPAITPDGTAVAFASNGTNLVVGDTNGVGDLFVRALATGVTSRASVGSGGEQADAGIDGFVGHERATTSTDGNIVAFVSAATTLVPGSPPGLGVFVRDRAAGLTERIGDALNMVPALDAAGRFVTYTERESSLSGCGTEPQVLVHDRQTGRTICVSRALDGSAPNGPSFFPRISADGRLIAFVSGANNLIPGDTNGQTDAFVAANLLATCGNLTLDPGEACDDGDTIGGDGCSADCSSDESCGNDLLDPGESCDDGTNDGGEGECLPGCGGLQTCGDATTNGTEACDDGTNDGGEGQCLSSCGGIQSCGDGTANGTEACDDGANDGGDGQCLPGCGALQSCGDGTANGTETCDDGANDGGDGQCLPGCSGLQSCGDGTPNGTEACDDASNDGGEGECLPGCGALQSCGNGIANGTETCDDGANDGGDGQCLPGCGGLQSCGDGTANGTEGCDDGPNDGGEGGCLPGCGGLQSCGDGTANGTEACDDGTNDGGEGECLPGCGDLQSCGDGTANGTEACDDGTNDGGEGECLPGCGDLQSCGDGTANGTEACDDGTNDGGAGECLPGCDEVQSCGDGTANGTEACDDGANDGGEGECLPGCGGLQSCGDGLTEGTETCDDGATSPADGCDATCAIDAGWMCAGQPSQCQIACTPAPRVCLDALRAKIQYSERTPGKEKMKVQWKKIASLVTPGDFGDPVLGNTSVAICIYDDGDALVRDFVVARANDLCAGKPCWKAKGTKGWAYGDKESASDGIAKLSFKGGDTEKGSADGAGRNNASKGQTTLPTGVVAALSGHLAPTIQMVTSEGFCVGATMNFVQKDADGQYNAGRR